MNSIHALRVATKDRPKIFRLVVVFLFLVALSTIVVELAVSMRKNSNASGAVQNKKAEGPDATLYLSAKEVVSK